MSTKNVKNIREPLKKPRPLQKSISVDQTKEPLSAKARVDIMNELEGLNLRLSNCDSDESVTSDITMMCSLLKKHGEELDSTYKEALDRFFCTLRNICREDRLDVLSRLRLLEIIEMRAERWRMNENVSNYFNSRYSQLEEASERQNVSGSVSPNALMNIQNHNFTNASSASLAPGETYRSSGKFSKPTKIAGKNYYKDEIVIRNCDSGKVNAGARDRLVQITGPHEESISHAKYLVEDTIKRNVSPVRDNLNTAELNLDNKEHVDYGNSFFDRNNYKRNLSHSYSMNDASVREFSSCPSIPVHINNDVIYLSGANKALLKEAISILTDHFEHSSDTLDKESNVLSLTKTSSMNNQRFPLKKQASLKDNLPSTISSVDHGFSRRSSSMSSSSDSLLPDEESSDIEAISPPVPAPIPPPTYHPIPRIYEREFLLECARKPLSQKQPPNYEQIISDFPDLIPEALVMFDPTQYLQKQTSQ